MQDKLGGITDIMKKADLYRQGDIGQMYMADGGRMGGIMGSNAGSMLVTPTRDGSRPGYYGPDAGHENDPGHGANAPGDDHSYKRENRIQQQYTPVTHTTAPGTLSDPIEKQDYFTQTYSGQPNFLGFGGYRNLRTPNEAGSGYQSRLNPMGLMSLLGGFISKPFTLAATGINALRNKYGPAWKDWTAADNLAEFLRRRRTGETITNPAVRGEYGLPAINIDEEEEEEVDLPHYRPSIDYPFDWWNKNLQIWGDLTFPPHKNPHMLPAVDDQIEMPDFMGTSPQFREGLDNTMYGGDRKLIGKKDGINYYTGDIFPKGHVDYPSEADGITRYDFDKLNSPWPRM
jgi:hypothetical protein